ATAFYLRLAHGWDGLSALLGASPGSMAQVMALSAEFGADVRGIAIVHVMRVLLIVLGLPAGTCAVRLDCGARRVDAGRNRTLARRTCDPPNGVGPFGTRYAVHKISGRPLVRCHGRLCISTRDGFDPCFAAVVGAPRCSRWARSQAQGSQIRAPKYC